MKKLKYILTLILVLGTFHSCLVDDETNYELNGKGQNLAGFAQSRTSFSFVSDGDDHGFTVPMKVTGPRLTEIASPISVTVAADASSTAIEGKHFKLDQPIMTLEPGKNLLSLFPITIITDGIHAPLETAPILVLKVASVTGDPSVINSGKLISITLNYGCFSNLEGTYAVSTEYTTATGDVSMLSWTEYITQTGVGEYRTGRVGHWTVAALGNNPGFTFQDVCGALSVPGQNLVDFYSNWVEGTSLGSVDAVTGDLYIEYSVCSGDACRLYKSTYVKQ